MAYDAEQFARSIRRQCGEGDLDGALARVIDFTLHVIARDGATGRVASSPLLDQLCQSIGAEIKHPLPLRGGDRDDVVVIVATTITVTGVHTHLMRQIMTVDPALEFVILLTNTPPGAMVNALPIELGRAVIECAPAGKHVFALSWLRRRLIELSPARTYLAIHGFDAVAVAAMQPDIGGRVFFNHVNDHTLSLGVHLDHATHVDYHREGYDHCCASGVKRQTYWPLTVSDPHWKYNPNRTPDPLVTCTAGGLEDFELPFLGEAFPRSLSYDEMVAHILLATNGRHIHVGPLAKGILSKINTRLAQAGIELSNFQYIASCGNLLDAFCLYGANIYISSMPRGVGLATLEAMSAGLPIIAYSNYKSRFFGDTEQAYPEAPVWRTYAELREKLRSLTLDELIWQGQLSSRLYQEWYSINALRFAWSKTWAGERCLPPQSQAPRPLNELRAFLDERGGCEAFDLTFADRQAPWSSDNRSKIQPGQDFDPKGRLISKEDRRTHLHRLCMEYAARRIYDSQVRSSGQVLDPKKFVEVIVGRCGLPSEEVSLDRPFFINFMERPPGQAELRDPDLSRSDCDTLFLADVLKAQGFFDDSLKLYGEVTTGLGRASALRGRGDLLLTLSNWAMEFKTYAADGRALNPYPLLNGGNAIKTWHQADIESAINDLECARKAEPYNSDGIWLLMAAYRACRRWAESARLAGEYADLRPEASDAASLRIRAKFPLDPPGALEDSQSLFSEWRDGFGRSWLSRAVALTSAKHATFTGDFKVVDAPRLQPVFARVVQSGQILEFSEPLSFSESYISRYRSAIILPLFGMILANEQNLISESLHHRRVHFDVFTPSIVSMSEKQALLFMPEPQNCSEQGLTFIGSNGNFYHWLMDELPRLRLLEHVDALSARRIVVDKLIKPWQVELLRRFGIPESQLVRVDLSAPVQFSELEVPSHLSTLMVAHPEAVLYVRNKLIGHALDREPKRGKRLYLTRKGVSGRSLMNADEVESCFRRAGFVCVDPGLMTIDEQIALFSDVEIVAGPGGAALTNMVFAPSNAKLVSLSSSEIMCQTFTSLTSAIGQEHWFCGANSVARTYPRWIWTNFDFEVDLKDVKLALDCVC